jgi:phage gpG-like protein
VIKLRFNDAALADLRRQIMAVHPRAMVEVHRALQTVLIQGAQDTVQKYFAGSGPARGATNATMLTSRSGALLESIAAFAQSGMDPTSPSDSTVRITATFGSDLPYARIQEYGGVAGRAQIKKPGGQRPYLPPRPYLAPTLIDMTEQANALLQEALRNLGQK